MQRVYRQFPRCAHRQRRTSSQHTRWRNHPPPSPLFLKPQPHLPTGRRAECARIECRHATEAVSAAGDVEALAEQRGVVARAALAVTEGAAGQALAPQLAQRVQHPLGTLGAMALQPVLEQSRHLARQAEHGVAGKAGAGLRGGAEDGFQFVVGERGDDGRHQIGRASCRERV